MAGPERKMTQFERAQLLRRPPSPALDWAVRSVDPHARLVTVRPITAATSSAMHRLIVDTPSTRVRCLLRRFVRIDWLEREPDVARREAAALTLLEGTAVKAPRLIAVDANGSHGDVPAVLMTRMKGRTDSSGRSRVFATRLAEELPRIHAIKVPDDAALPRYRPYGVDEPLTPPVWTKHPEAWERAIEIHRSPPPPHRVCFIHREYEPGNVLWAGGHVCGIVDWVSASVGAAEVDVGHCRMNLASRFGLRVADRFLNRWHALSRGSGYHPYWDVVAAVGLLGDGPISPDNGLDQFVAHAVDRFGAV